MSRYKSLYFTSFSCLYRRL